MNINKRKWLLALLLLVLIIPARITGVEKFATYDEPWWVISGSNFYYALTHREFENTVYDYHPAVTTTWVVTAGMLSYFPEYRTYGQGYFDVRKPLFENFMREQGRDALPLLRNSRLIQIAVIAAFALLCFFLLQLLIDEKAAFFSIVLAMNAPFFMGNSRLLNHEAMLSMFALTTLLAMQVYLNQEKKLGYLLISGAAFGLAQLTKSSSIVLLPLIGLILVVGIIKQDEQNWKAKFWDAVKIFLIWFAAALFVYVLLWPGMWVAPLKMFHEVYGNAFNYALQGARLDVAEEATPEKFSIAASLLQVWSFANQWIQNSTPLSWLGLFFAPFLFTAKTKSPTRSTLVYLFLLAFLVMLLFGIAQGRDSSHYVLTSFVCLDVIAGIGWAYALTWLQTQRDVFNRAYFLPAIFAALLAFQLGSTLLYYPYYYTYKNPFVNSGGIHGYGEGLDQAAEYLAQKPNAKDMRVIAYAGRGCFSYFYPGRTDHMKVGVKDELPYIEEMQDADYIVVYNIRQKGRDDGAALINTLRDVPPERIINMDGFEYARIYKVMDLPKNIFGILTGN